MDNTHSPAKKICLSAFILIAIIFASIFFIRAMTANEGKTASFGVDTIIIDTIAAKSSLELPPVVFNHETHVTVLAKQDKDCTTCHRSLSEGKKGLLDYAFMGIGNQDGKTMQEMFHSRCISCHDQEKAQNNYSGPLESECRSCHYAQNIPLEPVNMVPSGMNKELHYRHIASKSIFGPDGSSDNCGACHHIYDETQKKLVWGKGQEDSCRLCHAEKNEGNVPSFSVAAHIGCISCHYRVAAKKKTSGPYLCFGCHSAEGQKQYKTVGGKVPRLMRGQPDATLIMPRADATGKGMTLGNSMRPVAFDHKQHEGATADCRSCHHKKIAACSSCHTLAGKEEGGYTQLAVAMHKNDSPHSCLGCHLQQQQKPECLGCHKSGNTKETETYMCHTCHATPVGITDRQAEDGSLRNLNKTELAEIAAATVLRREEKSEWVDQRDMPDMVKIDVLSKEYEVVNFPHRRVVKSIVDKMKGNKLAADFHSEMATICQGCHHNSTPSLTPPKCASCHAASDAPGYDGRPSLKAAFHLQCINCHIRMEISAPAATDCAACHKPLQR